MGKPSKRGADFNSDGKSDILWQHPTTGDLSVWFMNGTAQAGASGINGPTDWRVPGAADLNGDGQPDILWQLPSTGELWIWYMNGATTVGQSPLSGATSWRVVGTGDFNGDGKPDILWQQPTSGDLWVWYMNGATQLGAAAIGGATTWKVVGTGDFNGDGKPDILWQQPTSGDLWVSYMNGATQTGAASIGGATAWKVVGTGDFNGDGKPDILWQLPSGGDLWVWFMNGSAQTGAAQLGGATTWTAIGSSYVSANVLSVSQTGTQVTIAGTGFGWAQGTGTVWLGSTLATVVSWSENRIVATVAPNSTSGTVRVQQAGVWSNTTNPVAFTMPTAAVSNSPPISGSPGAPFTVTGSGFGASQSGGKVWLGTDYGVVQSWTNTQIVAQVAAGSTSGVVQVLQGGVWSTPVAFAVNTPRITSISPASGLSGTSVTFTGTGFGSSPGSAMLGSIAGQVTFWSDTQVNATVAVGSLSGIARIQQNGVWSNAYGFVVPTGGSSAAKLVPALLNMAVGDTRTLQAWNSAGQPVTGLTWASSNSAVVSLSSDNPPVLTALTVGHVTISAGGAATDVTVSAGPLTPGTVICSIPTSGSSVNAIIPAVPSASGVADVFAFQSDGTVQAITSDGAVAWTANVGPTCAEVPDFQGGVSLLQCDGNIVKLDGITGQAYPAYSVGQGYGMAVHPDGTVFITTLTSNSSGYTGSVIGIDPTTGAQKFSVPITLGFAFTFWWRVPLIAGDGYAYVPYATSEGCGSQCQTNHLKLLRVSSTGASSVIGIKDWSTGIFDIIPVSVGMITNADTGVLLTIKSDGYYMATTTGTSVSIVQATPFPGQASPYNPMLQAQDGSFVGTVFDDQPKQYMVAFDASGNMRWSVPDETPLIATADGGVIGQSGITYNQSGSATGQIANMPTYSWLGYAYRLGSVDLVLANLFPVATSWMAFQGANNSRNGTAAKQQAFAQLQSCTDPNLHPPPSCPGPRDAIFTAWYWLKQRIGDSGRASSLDANVFHDSTGTTRQAFSSYLALGQGPEFYDGPKSFTKFRDAGCPVDGTVETLFRQSNNSNTCEVSAITCREDPKKPLRAFFEPRAFNLNTAAPNDPDDAGIALLFHEAMHGFTKKMDADLQESLGCTKSFTDTRDITLYLRQFIRSTQPPAPPQTCVDIEQHNMPGSPNVCVR
jgi:hypothetical protein